MFWTFSGFRDLEALERRKLDWMEAGDANTTPIVTIEDADVVTSGGSELKRGCESILDPSEVDSVAKKKQAIDASSESASEVSDANNSVVENPSGCQIVSGQPDVATISVLPGRVENVVAESSTSDSNFPSLCSTNPATHDAGKTYIFCGVNGKLKIKFSKRCETAGRTMGKLTSITHDNNRFDFDAHGMLSDPSLVSGSQSLKGNDLVGSVRMGRFRSTSRSLPREYMELKMSKKVTLDVLPTSVKKLLHTGLLDGVRVNYVSPEGEITLAGAIKKGNYLCGCHDCNYSRMLSAIAFERHAGGCTKHPNSHIFLENGKSVYAVLQALRNTQLNMVEEMIESLVSLPQSRKVHPEVTESFSGTVTSESGGEVDDFKEELSPSDHVTMSAHQQAVNGCTEPAPRLLWTSTKQKQFNKKRILDDESSQPSLSLPPFVENHVSGKPKKRDNNLHRLLFMPNGLPEGTELAYYSKGQRVLNGYKQGSGIVCSCCNEEISPSQFEAHAGWATRRQPYRNIYTPDGLSLHDLALSLSNGEHLVPDDGDDICTLCGDGGNLLLCDSCPRAFHTFCLGLLFVPEGNWNCSYCKSNGAVEPLASASRPITIRLRRVVKAPVVDVGGCVICRDRGFSPSASVAHTVLLCDQCEKEYHIDCLREHGLFNMKEIPRGKWFCSSDCNRIHAALGNLFFNKAELVPSVASNILKMKLQKEGMVKDVEDVVEWQLLSGAVKSSERKMLLSKAVAIFQECFDPIVLKSGRDLVPAMVYGRSIDGYDFRGMFCAVLIVNSVVVSAGIVRVFGTEAAELPLVATSKESQGKGYFQALFACIEKLLGCLGVENLLLPAAEDVESIWTNKLGFMKMSEDRVQKYMRDNSIMVFQGTSMLERKVHVVED